jgi:hypothetical protein
MNELRELFKKERDRERESTKETRENKPSKTDRSDFEAIIQMLFNRFKVIKDDKENYETSRNRIKSQMINRDSTTKTHKFDKKNGFGDTKAKASNNDLSQSKEKDS